MAPENRQREYPAMSPREVEALIADGHSIIILDQHVLKVDAWITYHPGGDKTIMHMVGRDGTDEITMLHSPEARQMMDRYRIGRIEGQWKNMKPPIQGGVYRPRCASADGNKKVEDDVAYKDEDRPKDRDGVASSTENSRSPSPVFDSADEGTVRHRRTVRLTSVSSVSSTELDDGPLDGMAHLDFLTKKEIKLDQDRYPSLDRATQDMIVKRYRMLNEKMKVEGLYKCNYWAYGIECARYAVLFGLMSVFLRWGWYATSAFFLGLFWHQLVFTAHDAGHMGITHNFQVDTTIGIVVADFIGGLSIGWWKHSHNVHHVVTNMPEHDPDIEHMPLFAISHRLLGSLRSTYYERIMTFDALAKFMLRIQHYTYYVILLFGRFNLYRLSWEHIMLGLGPRKGPAWWHRWLEMAGQVFFWYWFGYELLYKRIDTMWHRVVFILISHCVTSPLHVQITLSHFAMSTADLGIHESFPQRQLRTTMDVDCPSWLDFVHGGLQFQAVHHLYPRLPRHNLRRAQKFVQEFCDEVGIPYALYGFVDGNHQVVGRLADVARQAAIFAKCQAAVATEPLHGHHHH